MRVEMTLIEGDVYFDRKEDLKRRETIAKEKKELIEKEANSCCRNSASLCRRLRRPSAGRGTISRRSNNKPE